MDPCPPFSLVQSTIPDFDPRPILVADWTGTGLVHTNILTCGMLAYQSAKIKQKEGGNMRGGGRERRRRRERGRREGEGRGRRKSEDKGKPEEEVAQEK